MTKAESADLILKLYDLRREEKLRKAREWMITFFPESGAEIFQTINNPETSAYYRMVTTYWDMACALVLHEAIDAEMFQDTAGEYIAVFSKIYPHLAEIRELMGNPGYLKNLETLIMLNPNADKILTARLEMLKKYAAARAEFAKSA
jgi:hypothetical protein